MPVPGLLFPGSCSRLLAQFAGAGAFCTVSRLRVQNQLQQMAELRPSDHLVLVIAIIYTMYDHQIASRDNDDKVPSDASCRE